MSLEMHSAHCMKMVGLQTVQYAVLSLIGFQVFKRACTTLCCMCLGIRSCAIDPVSVCYASSLRVMCHKTAQVRHHLLDICKKYKREAPQEKVRARANGNAKARQMTTDARSPLYMVL